MHWLLIGIALVAVVIVTVVVVGWLLPEEHRASCTAVIQAPPQAVWDIVTAFERIPEWRSGISKVQRLSGRAGEDVWQETDRRGESIAYEVVEAVPIRKLVRRIATPDLPFGGSWTIDLEPASKGTSVTITENGQVHNPVFRFVSRFVMGHTATMERYLSDMEMALANDGASVTPDDAPGHDLLKDGPPAPT